MSSSTGEPHPSKVDGKKSSSSETASSSIGQQLDDTADDLLTNLYKLSIGDDTVDLQHLENLAQKVKGIALGLRAGADSVTDDNDESSHSSDGAAFEAKVEDSDSEETKSGSWEDENKCSSDAKKPSSDDSKEDSETEDSAKPVLSTTAKSPQPPQSNASSCKENVPNNNDSVDDPSESPPEKKGLYTKEQAELAELVLGASGRRDHHGALGLPTNAMGGDIRKSYKRLALKLHPDKNKAPNAEEAFKALSSAYDELMENTYDLDDDSSSTEEDSSSVPEPRWTSAPRRVLFKPGSSRFNTIAKGTRVTVQGLTEETHLNGFKGSVRSFNPQSAKYSVDIDINWMFDHGMNEIPPSSLFQNTSVKLRDSTLIETLGEQFATITSYGRAQGTYQVRHEMSVHSLRPNDFIIPKGTVVRLEGLEQNWHEREMNGSYGRVFGWKEMIENNGADTSYYRVQLAPSLIVEAKMGNVYL